MAKKQSKSLTEAVSAELKKGFDLNKFKQSKMLNKNVRFKDQKWIPLSPAFQEVTSIPGIPMGHITMLRGHSDTGKSTALLEAAISAQKGGVLPVFIITEMKWNWEHAIQMGLEVEQKVDEDTGEILDYGGNFIYIDRETIHTIEDVASFILDLIDEQKKGSLPYDLLFLWDSVGSVPCELSVRSNKNNNEWNAGAMSTQFGNQVNQRIVMSRKESSPYTNSLVVVNKVWTAKPESPMGRPKLENKGGKTMWYDATFIITFGNISNAGTSKIKAVKNGKQIEFAKRTNLQIDKNHINGITTRGKIIMTPHGFIRDEDKDLKAYKTENQADWERILGGGDFEIIEEDPENISPDMFEKET
jgi:RecA/RadA recombinase|tara:strand:+ start:1512 stop:2588 length:1077 start_codon:yes stop_codon:yes gene_type:complete